MENQEQNPVDATATSDDLIKKLVEYLAPVYSSVQEQKIMIQRFKIEKDVEIENAKFTVIRSFDVSDKWYKAIILVACLLTLGFCGFYDKLQSITPLIGVIIGLVLKSSSVNDFMGKTRNTDGGE